MLKETSIAVGFLTYTLAFPHAIFGASANSSGDAGSNSQVSSSAPNALTTLPAEIKHHQQFDTPQHPQTDGGDRLSAILLTSVFGFGLGHYYLDSNDAALFLCLDAAATLITIGGASVFSMPESWFQSIREDENGQVIVSNRKKAVSWSLFGGGLLALTAIRIWELVDIVTVAKEMRSSGIRVSLVPLQNQTLFSGGVAVTVTGNF
jgi:hypothetical protein